MVWVALPWLKAHPALMNVEGCARAFVAELFIASLQDGEAGCCGYIGKASDALGLKPLICMCVLHLLTMMDAAAKNNYL